MNRRPLSDAFGMAQRTMKDNGSTVLKMGAIFAAMNFIMFLPALMMDVTGIFDDMFQGDIPMGLQGMSSEQQAATLLQTGLFVVTSFVNAILWMGGLQLGLAMVDGKTADLWDAVLDVDLVPIAVLIAFVDMLILPAWMCCLFPGLVISACVFHWPTAVVDKPGDAMGAFSQSVDFIRNDFIGHTAMVAVLTFALMLGSLFYYIPAVLIFPFAVLTTAHMYRLRVPRLAEE